MAVQPKATIATRIWQRWLPLLHWPWELFLLLVTLAWLYHRTMPPGISSWIVEGWDSAVLQITGSTWGMPHSPGYPLYTILSNLFVRLVGLIPGFWRTAVVWRVSFWSTVTSLLAVLLVYRAVQKLVRDRAAAVIAGGLLGISFIFWRAAIMAEVYSLNVLIFALTFWLALVWDGDRRDRWLIALGLAVGAGLAHHRTAFILPPTVALWVIFRRPQELLAKAPPQRGPRWRIVAWRWLILAVSALPPLLFYLYLPWAAQNRAGQTWLYADASDWNTFWFVVLTREWWGLVDVPRTVPAWLEALLNLFRQQTSELTVPGVVAGILGLLLSRRYLWLLGPPFLAFVFFGASYHVADLDSMLIPLTLILALGAGNLIGLASRYLATWLVKLIRIRDEALRGRWLSVTIRTVLAVSLMIAAYVLARPLAAANYRHVDLSGDWQAIDLVEEVVAIAAAGTPLSIIGQDNSVLPDFIYSQVVLNRPVEPLSTTTLSRMPEEASIGLLRERFRQGRRLLVDIETITLGFIPWLKRAIDTGQIFLAPTGHPYLWELLPRPLSSTLPENEDWTYIPPGQFLDGRASIIAYQQRIIHKRTGCFLRLTLFWRLEDAVAADYNVAVQPLGGEAVLDKNDHLALMRGYLPTSQVRAGEIVRDEVDLLVRQPMALPGVSLVVNLYQVQGDQFPTYGQVTLPITVNPNECR
ncbi:MAG: DUF2723 domain-containing protein [Chloroflexota bacterium]